MSGRKGPWNGSERRQTEDESDEEESHHDEDDGVEGGQEGERQARMSRTDDRRGKEQERCRPRPSVGAHQAANEAGTDCDRKHLEADAD